MPEPEQIYSRTELATMFGVTPRTIVKWGRENRGPVVRVVIGKRTIRYKLKAIPE
jgi:DNA-binding XRE family transcriptional regulator